MPFAGYAALFFTVVLLVTTAYFLLGGLPLLVLQHDTPLDQRFVRRFFEVYYQAVLWGAGGATAGYALWGRAPFAAGMLAMGLLAWWLRRRVLPAMARLSVDIQAQDAQAIRAFRRVHALALLINLAQLVALVWGVTRISL